MIKKLFISSLLLIAATSVNAQYWCNANYSMSLNGLQVQFYDQSSTDSLSKITSWTWSFGDGNTFSGQNPNHTYNYPDTFNVCLVITTDNQCTDSICRSIVVTQGGGNCTASWGSYSSGLTSYFTDYSTNATSWLWNFGDGNTSNQKNPIHTYASANTYSVSLTIVDTNSSCQDTMVKNVTVTSGGGCTARYGMYLDSNNTAYFSDSSSAQVNSWYWDFGDGNSSTQQHPQHQYANPGTYTVCLTVQDTQDSTCYDRSCRTITIPGSGSCYANFSHYSSNLTAWFTDLSSSNMTWWYWSFGDGNSSVQQNPNHTYASGGLYYIALVAGDSNQSCTDSIVMPVTVGSGGGSCKASYTYTESNKVVTFGNTSTGNTADIYYWTFGDGNIDTAKNPTHTYAQNGTYLVCLTVASRSDSTCRDTYCDSIYVGSNPNCMANYTWLDSAGTIYFRDASLYYPYSWAWDFGDGYSATVMNPTHQYANAGTYQVCVVVNDSSNCTSTYCDSVTASTSIDITENEIANISIYPTLTRGMLNFNQHNQANTYRYKLLNIIGSREAYGYIRSNTGTIDLSDLGDGIYFLSLRNKENDNVQTVKVVKTTP